MEKTRFFSSNYQVITRKVSHLGKNVKRENLFFVKFSFQWIYFHTSSFCQSRYFPQFPKMYGETQVKRKNLEICVSR